MGEGPSSKLSPEAAIEWESDRPMDVLGRRLADPFDAFWERYGAEIPAAIEHIEEGHSAVFGDLGADLSAPDEPAWAGLPDDDLAYHVAHELAHILLWGRGYPTAAQGNRLPPWSEEARVCGDLQEMVEHAALGGLLGPFGFRNDVILDRTAAGATRGLASSPVPKQGAPWFATWGIRYCELAMEMGEGRWPPIEALYQERGAGGRRAGRAAHRYLGERGAAARRGRLCG